MSASGKSGSDFKVHPLLSQLLSRGGEACVFRGYVGPSQRDDVVRLYPSLSFLTFSIEIGVKDIVGSAPAPSTVLPYEGTVIWVRGDAEVVFHGDTVTTVPVRSLRSPARGVSKTDTAPLAERTEAASYVDVVKGRLRMTVPTVTARRADCDVCASCRGCASCTSVCQSG